MISTNCHSYIHFAAFNNLCKHFIFANLIESYIRISASSLSNSNYKLNELKSELNDSTPSNFRIGFGTELRTQARIIRTENQVTMAPFS